MRSLGVLLPLRDDTWSRVRPQVELVVELGLDGIWLRDVPLAAKGCDESSCGYDPVALLSAVAGMDMPIREFGTAVLCPTYRPLWTLTREIITLQALTGNRALIGLGSGLRPAVNRAFAVDDANRQGDFVRSVRTLRAVLAGDDRPVPADVVCPRPPGHEAPPLLIASSKPDVVAEGDGWLTLVRTPRAIREAVQALSERAVRAVPCTMQMTLLIDMHDPDRAPLLDRTAAPTRIITGTTALPRLFAGYQRAGVSRFLVHLPQDDRAGTQLRAVATAWHAAAPDHIRAAAR